MGDNNIEMINDHENRLKKIEANYANDINRILGILEQIQIRLVGSIDRDAPGLLTEVKQLEKEYAGLQLKLTSIDNSMKEMSDHFGPLKQIIEDVSVLKVKVETLNKSRWLAYGAILIISWLLANYNSFVPIISKAVK